MHSNISIGDFVTVHRVTGETIRTKVTFVSESFFGSAYFTAGTIRYNQSTGLPLLISGHYSVATPDEVTDELE